MDNTNTDKNAEKTPEEVLAENQMAQEADIQFQSELLSTAHL